jgi:hypothetical protein
MSSALALALLLASATPEPAKPFGRPDPTPPYRPIAVTLALAMAGAGALVLKKRMKPLGIDGDREIEVLASKALSPKVRVVLLRTDGREFLLSVGNEGASLISEWADHTGDLAPTKLEVELSDEPAVEPVRVQPAAMPDWSPAVDGLLALRKTKGPKS